jgi:hypothetical protein
MGSQDGVVNIWTRVGDGQSVGTLAGAGNFFFSITHSLDLGPHPTSCSVGTRVLSGIKRLSNDADR